MRFEELHIATRREAPTRVKSHGMGILIQAGYMSPEGELTNLGRLATLRIQQTVSTRRDVLGNWHLLTITTSHGEVVAELPGGTFDMLQCPACGYAAAVDMAVAKKIPLVPEPLLPIERVSTPGCNTIDSLAAFLDITKEKTAKAMLYMRSSDKQIVFVVIRGDMQISERKLQGIIGNVQPANIDQIEAVGAVAGYASPVGLHGTHVVVDDLIPHSNNLVGGANIPDLHLLNTNLGRDYQAHTFGDLTLAHVGDACANCEHSLVARTGILLLDNHGYNFKSILLALAEAHNDDHGMCLPLGAAPFDVYLMHVPSRITDTKGAAAEIYRKLVADDVAVLWDDREERAGVKFNDADLIGCPFRATIGEKGFQKRMVEFKNRNTGMVKFMEIENLADVLRSLEVNPA